MKSRTLRFHQVYGKWQAESVRWTEEGRTEKKFTNVSASSVSRALTLTKEWIRCPGPNHYGGMGVYQGSRDAGNIFITLSTFES